MLADTVNLEPTQEVSGGTVAEALEHLFRREPGLRNHIVDETGEIRPHVSVFVDGTQSGRETPVGSDSEIRVLHAVSGG
jgi:sulfur-carrier protein